ncbi:MAG: ABC transporter ATP-binding protein [Clostridia bacterium]|nr:ABC transporter ATP-binding protein [Clostridia bacterium]
MHVLEVKGLCKDYPTFQLRDISFSVRKGTVMGLIGRNGAGKTTTMKSILNIVRADGGQVTCFGMDLWEKEGEIKPRIGYAGGAAEYFKKRTIGDILSVTRRFYAGWDEEACRNYLELFALDTNKTPSQLSQGMKVKLNLVLALSHGAELLILDEPTSGLDPISREELLEIFRLLRARGVSLLFSTHITSDLEKCADDITYIREGQLVYSGDLRTFVGNGTLDDVMLRYEKEAFREKLAL